MSGYLHKKREQTQVCIICPSSCLCDGNFFFVSAISRMKVIISALVGMLLDRPMHSHSTLSLLTQHSSPLTPHRPHNLIRDDITITSSVHIILNLSPTSTLDTVNTQSES